MKNFGKKNLKFLLENKIIFPNLHSSVLNLLGIPAFIERF
jgi:hypothetical protein